MSLSSEPHRIRLFEASVRGTSRRLRSSSVTAAVLIGLGCSAQLSYAQAAQGGSPDAAQHTRIATQAAGTSHAPVLSGYVTDPDDAAIPGAILTLTPAQGKAYPVTSGADGSYTFAGVPAGLYSLTVTAPGFATYVKLAMHVRIDYEITLNPKLAIQNAEQVVQVTTTQNKVSVDPDQNADASVLKGKALDALSDDPDELQQELTALAGPAAGPNGGQIYIDGFTGGTLPPKSSIREIRINRNPFSAEYDRVGYGRVEVFTKPGTDKIHGFLQLNGLDKAFNTGSPFVLPGTPEPPYHTIFSFGTLTGPLSKSASYSLNGSYRNVQDNTIVDPASIYATSQTSGTVCTPGQSGCAIYSLGSNGYSFANSTPRLRWDFAPRVDFSLGKNNTATVRVHYEHNRQRNAGIGGNDIFSTGTNSTDAETTVQISDTQTLSSRLINETRFEYQRPTSVTSPLSQTAAISVQGAFNGGGSSAGLIRSNQTHYELQNYTSAAFQKHFLRFGGKLRVDTIHSTVTSNPNGTFTYSSVQDYVAGNLRSYALTLNRVPTVSATRADLGLYAEDDWKIRPNLTFSYGLRYETQNFIHDQADFAPRLSVAYGISKKTVLRAGLGWFYDRFALSNQLTTERDNGLNEQSFFVASSRPSGASTIDPACNPTAPAACMPLLTAAGGNLAIRQIAPNLRASYNIQANLGIDQQLAKNATLSINYQHIRGLHGFNSDVPNFASATGTLADPIVYQFQSNGVYNQDQIITHLNYNGKLGSIGGFYVLNFAKSDFSGATSFASVPNQLRADYGRASFDRRNRTFIFGSLNLPYSFTVSPFLVANSGAPYDITAGTDLYRDNIYNTRAVLVAPGTPTIANGYVKSIAGCGTFATPGTPGNTGLVPHNYCTGPASFTLNLRVVKSFGFGHPRVADSGSATAQGGPHHGHGGRFGGGATKAHLYNFSVGAQAQNIFNIVDRSTPVGTLTSPIFGTSAQLAGNIFTTDSAVRRVMLQASFSF